MMNKLQYLIELNCAKLFYKIISRTKQVTKKCHLLLLLLLTYLILMFWKWKSHVRDQDWALKAISFKLISLINECQEVLPVLNFIIVLQAALVRKDPKSIKKAVKF